MRSLPRIGRCGSRSGSFRRPRGQHLRPHGAPCVRAGRKATRANGRRREPRRRRDNDWHGRRCEIGARWLHDPGQLNVPRRGGVHLRQAAIRSPRRHDGHRAARAFPFVVATFLKWKTLADLVAAGRMQPSPLTSGSVGIGSSGHLALERLMHGAKFKATIVPFRGAPEAVTELAAGRLDMYAGVLPNVLEIAKAGQINLVGVVSPKRSALVPDVPTTLELGYPGSDYNFWMGSYLPAMTPRPIVERTQCRGCEGSAGRRAQDKDQDARRRDRNHVAGPVQRLHCAGTCGQCRDREVDRIPASIGNRFQSFEKQHDALLSVHTTDAGRPHPLIWVK